MFDVFTGWKISVEPADAGRCYIIVPAQRVGALCRLLDEHGIPHTIEGEEVPSRHHADSPSVPVVRLGIAVEATRVQELLDAAP